MIGLTAFVTIVMQSTIFFTLCAMQPPQAAATTPSYLGRFATYIKSFSPWHTPNDPGHIKTSSSFTKKLHTLFNFMDNNLWHGHRVNNYFKYVIKKDNIIMQKLALPQNLLPTKSGTRPQTPQGMADIQKVQLLKTELSNDAQSAIVTLKSIFETAEHTIIELYTHDNNYTPEQIYDTILYTIMLPFQGKYLLITNPVVTLIKDYAYNPGYNAWQPFITELIRLANTLLQKYYTMKERHAHHIQLFNDREFSSIGKSIGLIYKAINTLWRILYPFNLNVLLDEGDLSFRNKNNIKELKARIAAYKNYYGLHAFDAPRASKFLPTNSLKKRLINASVATGCIGLACLLIDTLRK